MYYLSGIYNKKEAGIKDHDLGSLSASEENSHKKRMVYFKDNFGFLAEYPPNPPSGLTIPLFDIDEKNGIVILLEGKVYNLKKILLALSKNSEKELSKKTDCQIIGFLYRQFGINFFKQLEGNFLLIIFDKKSCRIFLHKSKFSTKPLYYFLKNGSLTFSSLLNSLLKKDGLKKEINLNYLYSYLFLDNLSLGEETEYKDIKNLQPGYVLIVDKNNTFLKKISYADYPNFDQKNNEEITDYFQEVLSETMTRQLSGLKCANIAFSGGLDSRIIGEYAKKMRIPINTYTVRFKTKAENKIIDYDFAQKNSKKIGATHHTLDLSVKKFINDAPSLLDSSANLINFNNFNTLYILNWISKLNSPVITGDGTEEQLSVYKYHFFPFFIDSLLSFLPEYKREERLKISANDYFELFFTRSWEQPSSKKENIYLPDVFLDKNIRKKIKVDFREVFYKHLGSYPAGQSFSSFLNKALWVDFNYNLAPKASTISNYLSKRNSSEAIFPFFDQKFVSTASSLPANLKIRPGRIAGKDILRECAKKIIGEKDAFATFKSGSDIPFEEWLIEPPFERLLKEKLNSKRIKKFGIIDPLYVEKILKEHYANRQLTEQKDIYKKVSMLTKDGKNHTHKLLKMLGLQFWLENNF